MNVLFFNFAEGALLPVEVKEHFEGNEGIHFEVINTPLDASIFLQEKEDTRVAVETTPTLCWLINRPRSPTGVDITGL